MPSQIRIFQLFELFRKIREWLPELNLNWEILVKLFKQVAKLLPLPNWSDVEKTRLWVLELLGASDLIADLTPTELDDKVIAALQKFAENVNLWTAFYSLLVDLFEGTEAIENNPRLAALAKDAKINPSIIILIIQAILKILDWWRNRDADASSPVTENND